MESQLILKQRSGNNVQLSRKAYLYHDSVITTAQPVQSVAYNGINGIIYNNTILATGCFSARELWRLSKTSIMAIGNGANNGLSTIKLENTSYYTTYTSPVPDHSLMTASYSPLSVTRGHDAHSPLEPRPKRVRRLSSEDENHEIEKTELTYYTQSPAPLSAHAWHADLDHGGLVTQNVVTAQAAVSLSTAVAAPSSSTYLLPHTPPLHNSQHSLGPPSVHSPHLVHVGGGKTSVAVSTTPLPPLARAGSVESLSGHDLNTRGVSPHPREGKEKNSHKTIQSSWTVLPSMTLSGGVMSAAPYYSESQEPTSPKYENGHDTFSDFVTLVCQEPQNTTHHTQQPSPPGGHGGPRSPSKLQSTYYTTPMLPPPPPPPTARPVAIIRSTGNPPSQKPSYWNILNTDKLDLGASDGSPGSISPPPQGHNGTTNGGEQSVLSEVSPPDHRRDVGDGLSPPPSNSSAPPVSQ
ncbi:hypothetical protein Avbf_04771, partial [Armadillidium vulgare]